MPGITETSRATAIRPFTIPTIPDAALEDLRGRVTATRWPDPELVGDFSQGVQQAVMQELARYWATEYDMRRYEKRLSALPNFITEIDGLDIHFIHVRSPHEKRSAGHHHAWLAWIGHRAAEHHRPARQPDRARCERSRRVRRGHPVDPGLRVLGQAAGSRLGS
jgi:Epoxide hydrolase N terminus